MVSGKNRHVGTERVGYGLDQLGALVDGGVDDYCGADGFVEERAFGPGDAAVMRGDQNVGEQVNRAGVVLGQQAAHGDLLDIAGDEQDAVVGGDAQNKRAVVVFPRVY